MITYDKGLEYAADHNADYYETSALSALGVDLLFESVAKTIVKNTPSED